MLSEEGAFSLVGHADGQAEQSEQDIGGGAFSNKVSIKVLLHAQYLQE